MFQRRTIEVETPTGKGQVALVEFGDPARPVDVVFSHANGFNAYTYRSILDPLAADLRVVAYDLRGHGRTTLPVPTEARPDWWDLCDDLLAVMDALALEKPVVLAGHSFGATVSLMAAQRRPEAVKALALFDPVLYPNLPGLQLRDTPMVEAALRRRSFFESRAAAIEKWRGRGAFAAWPEEILADYTVDGLITEGDGVRLACSPAWEASSYMAQGQNGVELLLGAGRPVLALIAEQNSTCQVKPDNPRLPLPADGAGGSGARNADGRRPLIGRG